MQGLLLQNKPKIHNYASLNCKCTSNKATAQWMNISVIGDQKVKVF